MITKLDIRTLHAVTGGGAGRSVTVGGGFFPFSGGVAVPENIHPTTVLPGGTLTVNHNHIIGGPPQPMSMTEFAKLPQNRYGSRRPLK